MEDNHLQGLQPCLFTKEAGCIRLYCQSVGGIADLKNQSQDSNESCDNASALTLEQDLGRV